MKPEKEEYGSLNNISRKTTIFFRGPEVDNSVEQNGRSIIHCSIVSSFPSLMSRVMESVQSLESNKAPQTTVMSTSEQMQALKIPEAVVALAQAAAKVNDETEKYLPGWSLLSPCKVQLLKCEKCSQEFCSTINYKRHIRVHRRSLNIDKDFSKNKVLLGAYWDKLRLEEAKEILSLKNVAVEDVTGSSIIKALTNFIQNLGFPLLPHIYVKAGATLLDLIEGTPSRFPISSQELFGVLDDASEKTFLCAGSAFSVQKYIFSGDAGKIAFEMKNLVAFASFMLEQKLVKLWYADKDVEALRYQSLLMEEEEAAKKRQTELQERKRLKKLRHKEKRVNIFSGVTKANNEACSFDTTEVTCSSAETASLMPASESFLNTSRASVSQEIPCGEPTRLVEPHLDWNLSLNFHTEDADQVVDKEIEAEASGCQLTPASRQILMLTQNAHPGEVPSEKSSVTSTNGLMIWPQKTKPDKEDANERNKCKVLIGSISVTLGRGCDHSGEASPLVQRHFKKLAKNGLSPDTANQTEMKFMKLWKSVCHDIADSASGKIGTKVNQFHADSFNHIPVEDIYLSSGAMDDNDSEKCWNSFTDLGSAGLSLPRLFPSDVAKSFLAERWKESMIADHVTLTLPTDSAS